jgi:F-type H+-transporting ATPase subunit b
MTFSSVLFLATEKTGGLFDLDATLPAVALQFLALMFILNSVLYTPLLDIMAERKNYVSTLTSDSSIILEKVNILSTSYKNELEKIKKEAKAEISNSQKLYKEVLEIETQTSKKQIDEFLDKTTENFNIRKNQVIASLEKEVDTLSTQITSKILA